MGAAEAAMPFVQIAWGLAPPGAPTEKQARDSVVWQAGTAVFVGAAEAAMPSPSDQPSCLRGFNA